MDRHADSVFSANTRGRSSGFTLTEVLIALLLLSISLLGLASVTVVNARAYDNASEKSLVIHAFREMAEKIRGAPFNTIAGKYQAYPFTISEIKAAGTVQIFLDETATSADAKLLGLPRDLDGDGLATQTNVAASYVLLPIKLNVTWENVRGPQTQSLYMILAQETN